MVLHNYFFIEFNNNTVRSYMNIQKKERGTDEESKVKGK